MSFDINNFRANLTGGGARPTLYKVFIPNPIDALGDMKMQFLCKAASLPESTMESVKVPYAGRTINVKGDRTFSPWSVTILNDEDFLIRNSMENWMSAMNTHRTNTLLTGSSSPASYKADGFIQQFSQSGVMLRQYDFSGMMPTNIAAIDMGYETVNTIQEFQVTFEFDYWEVRAGVTGTTIN